MGNLTNCLITFQPEVCSCDIRLHISLHAYCMTALSVDKKLRHAWVARRCLPSSCSEAGRFPLLVSSPWSRPPPCKLTDSSPSELARCGGDAVGPPLEDPIEYDILVVGALRAQHTRCLCDILAASVLLDLYENVMHDVCCSLRYHQQHASVLQSSREPLPLELCPCPSSSALICLQSSRCFPRSSRGVLEMAACSQQPHLGRELHVEAVVYFRRVHVCRRTAQEQQLAANPT